MILPFSNSSLNSCDKLFSMASILPICVVDVLSICATISRIRPIFSLSSFGLSLFSSCNALLYSVRISFNSFACCTFSQSVSCLAVALVNIRLNLSLIVSDSFLIRHGTFLYSSLPSCTNFKAASLRRCPATTSYFPCASGFTTKFCSMCPTNSIDIANSSMFSVE